MVPKNKKLKKKGKRKVSDDRPQGTKKGIESKKTRLCAPASSPSSSSSISSFRAVQWRLSFDLTLSRLPSILIQFTPTSFEAFPGFSLQSAVGATQWRAPPLPSRPLPLPLPPRPRSSPTSPPVASSPPLFSPIIRYRHTHTLLSCLSFVLQRRSSQMRVSSSLFLLWLISGSSCHF